MEESNFKWGGGQSHVEPEGPKTASAFVNFFLIIPPPSQKVFLHLCQREILQNLPLSFKSLERTQIFSGDKPYGCSACHRTFCENIS